MKKLLVAMAVVTVAGVVQAQQLGLPIAQDAATGMAGRMALSGGYIIGDDLDMYGARFAYTVLDEATVFADLGWVDPDFGSSELSYQLGGLYSLAGLAELPFDLALRATVGYTDFDYGDLTTFTAGALGSQQVTEEVSVYGFLGLAYTRTKFDGGTTVVTLDGAPIAVASRGSSTDSDTDPALGLGAEFRLTPDWSLYGEFVHIDDPWIGFGVKWRL